jgi:hypothetical protein
MDELVCLRAMSLEQVGARLGITRSRVMLIERRALRKVRCALALEAALGAAAGSVLASLRGKPVRYYEQAVAEAGPSRELPLAEGD